MFGAMTATVTAPAAASASSVTLATIIALPPCCCGEKSVSHSRIASSVAGVCSCVFFLIVRITLSYYHKLSHGTICGSMKNTPSRGCFAVLSSGKQWEVSRLASKNLLTQ